MCVWFGGRDGGGLEFPSRSGGSGVIESLVESGSGTAGLGMLPPPPRVHGQLSSLSRENREDASGAGYASIASAVQGPRRSSSKATGLFSNPTRVILLTVYFRHVSMCI